LYDSRVVHQEFHADVAGPCKTGKRLLVLAFFVPQAADPEQHFGQVLLKIPDALVLSNELFEGGAGLVPGAESFFPPAQSLVRRALVELRTCQIVLPPNLMGVVLDEPLSDVACLLKNDQSLCRLTSFQMPLANAVITIAEVFPQIMIVRTFINHRLADDTGCLVVGASLRQETTGQVNVGHGPVAQCQVTLIMLVVSILSG